MAVSLADAELDVLSPSFSRDRIASGDTILDVQIRRFADALKSLFPCVAPGHAAWQGRRGASMSDSVRDSSIDMWVKEVACRAQDSIGRQSE